MSHQDGGGQRPRGGLAAARTPGPGVPSGTPHPTPPPRPGRGRPRGQWFWEQLPSPKPRRGQRAAGATKAGGGAGTGQGLHVKRPPASCGERAKETKPCLPAIGATIGQAVHPLAGAAVWGDIVGRSVLAGVGLPEKSTGPAGKQVITQRMSLAILGTYLC